jgi:CRP-like cAMP-binding protein
MFSAVTARNFSNNFLFEALPSDTRDRLRAHSHAVALSLREVVVQPHERIQYAYFLTSSIVSVLYTTENGASAEMGVVGKDGMVGAAVLLGGESTCSQAVVAVAGEAIRVPAELLLHEFEANLTVRQVLLRYMQALITQISQTAVCNRLHSVEQRLCRWLLFCLDRSNNSDLHMTQELIAHILGGRRESVTVAAGNLQDLGLIDYCRGRISILDRCGLEAAACECYRVVADEIARLYGRKTAIPVNGFFPAVQQAG